MVKSGVKIGVKRGALYILSGLIGIIVITVAGFGIAYALKKKNILLVITSKDSAGATHVLEVKLKRDKDGSQMFTGTRKDEGESEESITFTLGMGKYEGSPMWLLHITQSSVVPGGDDRLVATHYPLVPTPIVSFLQYDPPTNDSKGWTTMLEGGGDFTGETSYSHSWF